MAKKILVIVERACSKSAPHCLDCLGSIAQLCSESEEMRMSSDHWKYLDEEHLCYNCGNDRTACWFPRRCVRLMTEKEREEFLNFISLSGKH